MRESKNVFVKITLLDILVHSSNTSRSCLSKGATHVARFHITLSTSTVNA